MSTGLTVAPVSPVVAVTMRLLFGGARIVDVQLEHEAVELRFGQRVGAFLLDRVLRGEHEERLRQRVRLAGRGHRVLLHRLEERRLRLRRGAVDLVGEHDVREDRALHEAEDAPAGGGVLLEQLRAGDVARHEVRRELDAREGEVEGLGQRAHEERLREAGHAHEQRVSAREERGDEVVDDGVLSDDAARDLRGEVRARAFQRVEQAEVLIGGSGQLD